MVSCGGKEIPIKEVSEEVEKIKEEEKGLIKDNIFPLVTKNYYVGYGKPKVSRLL